MDDVNTLIAHLKEQAQRERERAIAAEARADRERERADRAERQVAALEQKVARLEATVRDMWRVHLSRCVESALAESAEHHRSLHTGRCAP